MPLLLLKSCLRIWFGPLKNSEMGVYRPQNTSTPYSDYSSGQIKFWDHFLIGIMPLLLLKSGLRIWFEPLKESEIGV